MTLTPPGPAAATPAAASRWRPYPAYRPSGVDWLGDVPAHWDVSRLTHLTGFISRGESPDYVYEGGIPVLNQACVQWDGLHLENVRFCRERDVSASKALLRPGDIVINSTGTGTLGRCSVIDFDQVLLADSHVTIIRPVPAVAYPKYLALLLATQLYQDYVYANLVSGSTNQIELSREGLRALPVLAPPLPEQHAIAAFLDRETARLDRLIAQKERLIALLHEKRSALISQVVTKGLDPAAPMRDSGVPWVGEIPAHWQVKRLKFLLRSIEQGWSPQCENREADPEEWGVLKVGCVNGTGFGERENKALPASEEPRRELEIMPGDVVMSRANTRELLGSISFVERVRPRLLLCDKLYRLRPATSQLLPAYLALAAGSSLARFQFERDATGASDSMQNIGQDSVRNLVLPLPPLDEQEAILGHAAREEMRIQALVGKVQEHIHNLREYRAALIAAAVTGRIDVRGEVEGSEAVAAGEGLA